MRAAKHELLLSFFGDAQIHNAKRNTHRAYTTIQNLFADERSDEVYTTASDAHAADNFKFFTLSKSHFTFHVVDA
jgi:hypothetical protein